jgi:hypothetical protein
MLFCTAKRCYSLWHRYAVLSDVATVYPGCAARPWASELNRFAVVAASITLYFFPKTPWLRSQFSQSLGHSDVSGVFGASPKPCCPGRKMCNSAGT